jgi:outer membrane protein assembly factor BamB
MKKTVVASIILLVVLQSAFGVSAGDIIKQSGIKGGLVVHVFCGDGKLTASLRANDSYIVQGLCPDPANAAKTQNYIRSKGAYGPVSVRLFNGKNLPYADNLVNLIVADDLRGVSKSEVIRVLAPGGVAIIKGKKTVKPWPKDIDQWTHFLYDPSNNATSKDTVVSTPRSLQWVSAPRWGRSHEEMASMSSAVTDAGRVFFIVDEAPHASIRYLGDWKLVARDAFNGTLLWKKDIPVWNDHLRHFRSGPLHLPRRLVAAGDNVFVTLGLDAPVMKLDAATGKCLKVYKGTKNTEEILVVDNILYLAVGSSEVDRSGGGLFGRGEPEPTDFRFITAIDADSGKQLWKRDFTRDQTLLPLTLAVKDGSVYYQSTEGVTRLNARSGKEIWTAPRQTVAKRMSFAGPTLVITDDVVLDADRMPFRDSLPLESGQVAWGVHGWNEAGFDRKAKSKVIAYSVKDGSELWSTDATETYNSPVDIFVVDGIAWIGADFKGYDLKTGDLKQELFWKGGTVGMSHHRCYRNKATETYIFTGRSGIEVVDLKKGWLNNNSWIRGTCQYGIMPANGMLYGPPDACGCFAKAKLAGMNAVAPRRKLDPVPDSKRLTKGPAYGTKPGKAAAKDSWPMYRCDAARSANTSAKVPLKLKEKWSVDIAKKMTQPLLVNDTVFIAASDEHTVYSLKADSGKTKWTYTAGGRIDSAPTFYKGLLLFGSADGYVYCLRASDGELVWRFLAAPEDKLIGSYDQLESIWPVHGAVLIKNDQLYFSAGRSSFLDGGIFLYRLDPATGKQLSVTPVYHIESETDTQIAKEGGAQGLKFDMEGTTSDPLSAGDDLIYLKHLGFDLKGNAVTETKPHIMSNTGMLSEEWFIRSFWVYGTNFTAGWGGWATTGNYGPAGRLITFNDDTAFGYGRQQYMSAATGHRANSYQLYAMGKTVFDPATLPAVVDPSLTGKAARAAKPKAPDKIYKWSRTDSIIVRAMTLASDKLILAGVPDVGIKTEDEPLEFENYPQALDVFTGEKGGLLQIVSASTGKTLSEIKLDAPPVIDGMAVAEGKVLLSLRNGKLTCLQ